MDINKHNGKAPTSDTTSTLMLTLTLWSKEFLDQIESKIRLGYPEVTAYHCRHRSSQPGSNANHDPKNNTRST